MSKAKSWDEIREALCVPVRGMLIDLRDSGETQASVSVLRTALNRLGGHPGGLIELVLKQLKREGLVEEVMMMGNDGIVYLKEKDDADGS